MFPIVVGVAAAVFASKFTLSPPALVESVEEETGIVVGNLCIGEAGGVAPRAVGSGMVPVVAANTAVAISVDAGAALFTLGTGKGIGGGACVVVVVVAVIGIGILVGVGGNREKANTSDADKGAAGLYGTFAGDGATVGVEVDGPAGGGN